MSFLASLAWDLGALQGYLSNVKARLTEAQSILSTLFADDRKPTAQANIYDEIRVWLIQALHQVDEVQRDFSYDDLPEQGGSTIARRLEILINQCDEIALGMDFKFLFDDQRKIFVIGYNAVDHRNDNAYYDLLASESRLASFVAIAKGDVPQEHWFRLGRQLTAVKGGRALVSWTGTMFEYLMPCLVTRNYSETLSFSNVQFGRGPPDRLWKVNRKNNHPIPDWV